MTRLLAYAISCYTVSWKTRHTENLQNLLKCHHCPITAISCTYFGAVIHHLVIVWQHLQFSVHRRELLDLCW